MKTFITITLLFGIWNLYIGLSDNIWFFNVIGGIILVIATALMIIQSTKREIILSDKMIKELRGE